MLSQLLPKCLLRLRLWVVLPETAGDPHRAHLLGSQMISIFYASGLASKSCGQLRWQLLEEVPSQEM